MELEQAGNHGQTQSMKTRLGKVHRDQHSHKLNVFSVNCLLQEISLELFCEHRYLYHALSLFHHCESYAGYCFTLFYCEVFS